MSGRDRILEAGRNCWRIENASRLSFLIDGAAYFAAFAEAVEQARRTVLVVGWDIHSHTVLRPDREDGSTELGAFLVQALEARPELQVYLLEWDFSVLFALERDWTPVFRRGAWLEHRRLHFRFDDRHPWGASQHQKIVIIDDALAFVGGLDLTVSRWDTPEHLAVDPRRRLPDGALYPPFHDVQVAVDGSAARALAELARERWEKATGQRLAEGGESVVPWPESVLPDLENVEVAIARTQPSEDGGGVVREVEHLYIDAISSARELIYIENQYFTSPKVARALEQRLGEADGPELVLVLPRDCHGWLEESTMGALRNRHLARLEHANAHGRLRAVYPSISGQSEGEATSSVSVHAKVLVVDDRLLRIGSSNLSSRSMGFDSECDVALETPEPGHPVSRAIRCFRHRLLAEHLGISEEEVDARFRAESLIGVIDGGGSNGRSLNSITLTPNEWDAILPDEALVDPANPESPGRIAQQFVREEVPEAARHPWIRASIVLAVLLALAAAWRWTPLNEWAEPDRLAQMAEALRQHPLSPLIVIALYVVASLLMVPITGLILATALTFEPWRAIGYSVLGSAAAGLAGFAIGHLLARATVRKLAGARLNRVSQLLARRGVLAIMALRVLPAGPYTITNIVAGASHIRGRDFTLGTVLGLLPGILAVNLFKARVEHAIREPGWDSLLLAGIVLVVAVLGLAWVRRMLKRVEDDGSDAG